MIINKMDQHLYNFTPDMMIELMAMWKAVEDASKSVHETSCEVAHTVLTIFLPLVGSLEEKSPR